MLIYLAGPYTHNDQFIRQVRNLALTTVASILIKKGEHVWSPITESHQYADTMGVTGDWEYWKKHDLLMLHKCDELWVLMLKGWDTSVGVTAEIEEAYFLHKRIKYLHPKDYLGDYYEL